MRLHDERWWVDFELLFKEHSEQMSRREYNSPDFGFYAIQFALRTWLMQMCLWLLTVAANAFAYSVFILLLFENF